MRRVATLLCVLAACAEPTAPVSVAPSGTDAAPLDWPLQLRPHPPWSRDVWLDDDRVLHTRPGATQSLLELQVGGATLWMRLVAPFDDVAVSPNRQWLALSVCDENDECFVELRDLETGALSRRVPLASAFPRFAVDDDGVVVCAGPIEAPEPLHAIRVSVGDEAPFFAEELLAQARGRVPELVERWHVEAIALTRAHVALVLRDLFPTAMDDEADHLVLLVTRATRESSVFPLAEGAGWARWAELLSPRELALCHDGGCTQIDLVTGATRTVRRSPDAWSELHTSRSMAWCGSSRVEIGRHHVAVRHADSAWTLWNVETMRRRSIRACELAMLDGDRVLTSDARGAVVSDADTGREIARLDDVRRVAPHPSGGALAWTESGAYSVTDRGFELIGPSSVSLFGETRTWSSISDDLHTVFAFEQLDGRGERRRVGEHRLFMSDDVTFVVDERERTRAAIHAVEDGFVVFTPGGQFFGSPGSERALLRRIDEERVAAVAAGEADPQLFQALLASDDEAAAFDLEQ